MLVATRTALQASFAVVRSPPRAQLGRQTSDVFRFSRDDRPRGRTKEGSGSLPLGVPVVGGVRHRAATMASTAASVREEALRQTGDRTAPCGFVVGAQRGRDLLHLVPPPPA